MSFFDLVVLSVIQGIAEFLPISSSGHLILMGHWLGIQEDKGTLGIMLHAGTLLSIIVFYFHRIIGLLREDRRVIPLLIVGTIPAAILGVVIKKGFPELVESPWLAAVMLLFTGGILIASKFVVRKNEIEYQDANWKSALGIGFAQAFAILPGVSRSGTTIFAGQFLGLKRESAATFSFLLAIPIIAGATLYEIISMSQAEASTTASPMFLWIGAALSFVVGYISLHFLIAFVQKGKFHLFAYWCIPFGIVAMIILATAG